jgi:hypothetical protein
MKLKTLSLLVLLSAITSAARAQLEVKAGVNLANISTTSNGQVNDANTLTSFHAGFVGTIPLGTKVVSLQPGIFYTGKGSKVAYGTAGTVTYVKNTFNPQYIEVPVNLVFTFLLGSTSGIFVGAGPYAAIGVAGKSKLESSLGSLEQKIKWSNDDPTTSGEEGAGYGIMRRFDYGLNALAGVELQKVTLSVGYGYGLAKLQSGSNSSSNDENKNRVLNFSLGYRFGK